MGCTVTPASHHQDGRTEVSLRMLNEIFMAEKDAGKLSHYKLNVDGVDAGQFQSSGIIVSTGTGSSGWLYGAKRVTAKTLSAVTKQLSGVLDLNPEKAEQLGSKGADMALMEELANQMSKQTHFSSESGKMYYYVREPNQHSNRSEGFAQKIILNSELLQGEICADGQAKCEVKFGDLCTIEHKSEYALKCVKFIN